MKLWYVADARMPTEWAHGVQIAAMCQALAEEGAEVVLVVPDRPDTPAMSVADWYGLAGDFVVRRVPDLGWVHGRPLGSTVQRLCFAGAVVLLVLVERPEVVLTREELVAALASPLARTAYEVHKFPTRRLSVYRALVRRAGVVISTNAWKRDQLVEVHGVDPGRVAVLPNAAAVDRIRGTAPRAGLRAALGLPEDAALVLYSGHLHAWKGVETLVEAAGLLPAGAHVLLLGGTDSAIAAFRRDHAGPRLHVLGRCPPAEVAGYLRAADVLVLPNAPGSQEGRHETSPLKLFEYMASGRPIVASDLPSLREVIDEDCALLVPAGDPQALAEGIRRLLEDRPRAERLAAAAQARVSGWTWRHRARRVLVLVRSA